jgi:acyl-CoA synthetase (AMP-forming)/AMP-acid ligase II
MLMSAGLPFVEVFWGLQLLGAVPCALSPSSAAESVRRRIELVQPRIVITDEVAAEMRATTASYREPQSDHEDLAALQFTSGTSGEPRAAMISQRNVLAFLQATRGITADDVFVCWIPPWHDLGLMRFVIGPIYHRTPCFVVEPAVSTIPDWLATISHVGGTVTAGPDFAYRIATRMVDPQVVDLSTLRFATIAAEPVRKSTIEAFEDRFHAPGALLPAYGLAEATVGVSTHLPGERFLADERGTVSCGMALPGIDIRAGEDPATPEEILVRGEVVFEGYFGSSTETRRALRDGWLHTGDSGYLDPDGRLFVLGRRSGMIKRAGAVIAPRELEEAAARADGVRVAAALGVETARAGSEAITVVVEARTSRSRSAQDVAADVSREIVAACGFAPARVSVVDPRTIPRTANGKVRHERLLSSILNGTIA